MLGLIREFFSLDEDPSDSALDPISAALALLFEVVWADHDIDPAEVATMQQTLCQTFELDPAHVEELTAKARKLHEEAVGLHEFTSALNEHMDHETKYQVILAMWRVAYADQRIDALEEHIIRRTADLLYVSHSRFIDAKLKAKAAAAPES
ncbi:MAG: TerB family tellurite resistance protein [Pseudomonadales bacterium]